MKRHIGFLSVLLVGAGALVSCQDDTEHFDNKIYNTAEQTSTVFVEEEADSYVRTLQAQLAMPADSDISFAYVADPEQVEWYNTAYSDSAGMLPADYYEIPDPEAMIPAGETASSEVEIRFRNLLSLDKTQVYVLPVSIDGADVATLASRRTVYFVVKEASLINVVANLRENAVSVEWKNPDPLRNLRSLTAEALVKVDEFADGRGSNISTLMGVEGHFLLRFGDTAPNNQLQVVGRPAGTTVDEKLTSSDWTVKTGRWTHIAVTYDSDTHEVNVYIDGVKKMLEGYPPEERDLLLSTLPRQFAHGLLTPWIGDATMPPRPKRSAVSGSATLTKMRVISTAIFRRCAFGTRCSLRRISTGKIISTSSMIRN